MPSVLSNPLEFEFKGGISPDKAERVIAALGEEETPSRGVVLRFNEYPYVNTGVGWRVGNALRRYAGDMLEVRVPPFLEGQGKWYQSFTKSCLGDAIAAHAGRIVSGGADITDEVKGYYAEKKVRQAQNAVVWGELHRGICINPEPEQEHVFREQVLGVLKFVNLRPTHFAAERLQDVVNLTFEAIQNVYDHASRKPLPEGTKILSYVLLRYYNTITPNHDDPEGRLKRYLNQLPKLASRVRQDFIEICVNDDGVGIAARQSQNASIYWGPKAPEDQAVREALTDHSSVKLRTQDCRVRGVPGQGYTYIDACLRALKAFAIIRTGRLMAVLDGTEEAGPGFELLAGTQGYMPGTTLNVLIPILIDGDGLPTLFPDD
jgi:hypothetical protein